MAVTAAITAGLGVASIVSEQSSARKANKSQTRAADAALEEQRRQFDLNRSDLSPQIERGNRAGELQADFIGANGAEAEQRALDGFNESPGQRFLRERQERSLLRNEAAIGGLGGGNVRTALQEQAFGIASTNLDNRISQLGQVASGGANTANNLALMSSNQSNNISNGLINQGNAGATAALRTDAARQSGLSAIAGAFTGSGAFASKPKIPTTSGGGFDSGAFGLTKRFVNPITGK